MKYKPKEKKSVTPPKDWRKKLTVRSKARQMLNTGLIEKTRCVLCYSWEVKMVHVDYDSPKNVIFLCNNHYLNFMREKRNGMVFKAPMAAIA